jgi:ribonuclease HI
MSQIEIIVDSIKELIVPKDLETIRHFYFAPWNREVPYKITISRQPKEETAILHNLYLKTLYNNSSVLSIYTDGSQTQKGIGIGLGLVAYSHETPYIPVIAKYRESQNIGASAIVYNGELEGVTRAIEYASSKAKRGELYNIYTDNQAGLLRLKTPSDKPGQSQQIRAILATKALIAKGASIELIWVPGYTDIIGNEEADVLAKIGTTSPILEPELVKTSFAFLGVQINKVKKQEYRLLLESYTKPKT